MALAALRQLLLRRLPQEVTQVEPRQPPLHLVRLTSVLRSTLATAEPVLARRVSPEECTTRIRVQAAQRHTLVQPVGTQRTTVWILAADLCVQGTVAVLQIHPEDHARATLATTETTASLMTSRARNAHTAQLALF